MTLSVEPSISDWVKRLRKWLTTPTDKTSSPQVIFWFSLSLTCAALFGSIGLRRAFSHEYIVQDDARQHVFWMQRFLDPQLFPNDFIADYFQSVAQPGYKAIYQLAAAVGIDAMLFNKLLPILLGIIATAYCFGVCMQLLPVPAAGFVSALLLNQTLWMNDDLVSGTARSFVYPLFLAFLYYLLRRSLLPCLVALALQGLLYPFVMLISAGILVVRLVRWEAGKLRFSSDRRDYLFCATGVGITLLILLPLVLESSEYGPRITLAEAKTMPEFEDEGRSRFFLNSVFEFWLYADRSGFFPYEWTHVLYALVLVSFGVLFLWQLHHPSRFPLVKHISSNINVLAQISVVSVGLYFAAHALLFKLYLPSRYSQYSIRILTAFAGAIAAIVLLDAIFLRIHSKRSTQQLLALALTVLLGIPLISYPVTFKLISRTAHYVVGEVPEVYEFFLQQPKDTLIASLVQETDNLPSFAKRSVLVSREQALPYHKGYYTQFRQRVIDLIDAQFSPDRNQVKRFIQKYGVDFWIVERAYLAAYLDKNAAQKQLPPELNNQWLNQFPATEEARKLWGQGVTPTLTTVAERCSVLEVKGLVILQATCIVEAS